MERDTVVINIGVYAHLIRESEQLRILKNYVNLEGVYSKEQVQALIKAMEVEQ